MRIRRAVIIAILLIFGATAFFTLPSFAITYGGDIKVD